MSDIELLPCPFCGGSVRMEEVRLKSGIWHGIICRNTSNRGGSCAYECHPSRTPEAAAARWNMRSGYTAVDMATAAADGFRNGRKSVGLITGKAFTSFDKSGGRYRVTMDFQFKEDALRAYNELSQVAELAAKP